MLDESQQCRVSTDAPRKYLPSQLSEREQGVGKEHTLQDPGPSIDRSSKPDTSHMVEKWEAMRVVFRARRLSLFSVGPNTSKP
jgi:hypothetical protein